jgi:hypothetical protein
VISTMNRARNAATRSAFRLLNQTVLPPVRAGVASPPPGIGQGIVVLETTGRTSDQAREVPLAAVRVGNKILVSTVRDDSQWLKNLEASPNARLWTCGQAESVTAEVHRGPLNVVVLQRARAADQAVRSA